MGCISPELFVGHPFDGKKALIAFLEVAKRPKDLKTSKSTDWYKVFCHREICWKCSSPIPVYMQQFGLISLKRTSLSDLQTRLRLSHALLRRNFLVVSNRICPSFLQEALSFCMPFYMLQTCALVFNQAFNILFPWFLVSRTTSLSNFPAVICVLKIHMVEVFIKLKPRDLGLVCPPATLKVSCSCNDDKLTKPMFQKHEKIWNTKNNFWQQLVGFILNTLLKTNSSPLRHGGFQVWNLQTSRGPLFSGSKCLF